VAQHRHRPLEAEPVGDGEHGEQDVGRHDAAVVAADDQRGPFGGDAVDVLDPQAEPTARHGADEVQDEDGLPGLTVRIAGLVDGEIYIVQRGTEALDGSLQAPGLVRGTVTWTDEQVILGADNEVLEAGAPTRPDPDPGKSWFELRRADAATDCAWVRDHGPALFGE